MLFHIIAIEWVFQNFILTLQQSRNRIVFFQLGNETRLGDET